MTSTRQRLLALLREHQVVTLAVTDADGQPYAAALFYAVDEQLRLYVLTDPKTCHGRAMFANGTVAGTIQADQQQWNKIQGVQFRGQSRQLNGEARTRAWELYATRFGFLRESDAVLARELEKTGMWCIEPTWMRLIDNRLGFGHKEEWVRDAETS